METFDKMYKSVCRVCLKRNEDENMVSLLDCSSSDGLSIYCKAIMTFANVVVKSDDILPMSMCKNCLCFLKQAIFFKLKCEYSDNQLKKLAGRGFTEEDIKVKVVEYTMFTNYFGDQVLRACGIPKLNRVSQPYTQKVTGNDNIELEIAISQDSLGDDFTENPDSNAMNQLFDEKPCQQEDADAILDQMEKLIASQSEMPPTAVKKRFKKCIRLKKVVKRQYIRRETSKEPKSYVCNICDRILANRHSLNHHMQRHNGCKFVCEHCGKGFPVLSELQIHQVTMHGTGPYIQCRHCPYKAPKKFCLIEHERIHTGERPYTCDKCGLTFRRRFIWKKHLIYHTEKTVQCNFCPRKFYRRSEMLAHSNNVHERVYVYLCDKCGATYAKSSTVRRHLTERHGIPREMQGKIVRLDKGKADLPE